MDGAGEQDKPAKPSQRTIDAIWDHVRFRLVGQPTMRGSGIVTIPTREHLPSGKTAIFDFRFRTLVEDGIVRWMARAEPFWAYVGSHP